MLQVKNRRLYDSATYYKSKVPDPSYLHLTNNGIEGEILKDISRTFPLHPLFRDLNGIGQRILGNVLLSCSIYNKKIGYCQGMNFVAGIFILLRLDPNFIGFESDDHGGELIIKSYRY